MSKCLHPVQAWICGNLTTKDGVVSPRLEFSPTKAIEYYSRLGCLHLMDSNAITLPCNHCINCLMAKRKDMSVRLAHEALLHERSCFLTLTYDEDHVPTTDWQPLKNPRKQFDVGRGSLPELTLYPRDVQLFIKRLRRHLDYHDGIRIRYFAVGEYGGRTHRPHYHVMIFGWSPDDKVLHKMHNGNPVFRSRLVEKLWTFGFSSVSDVNPFVAKYAARYVTKKYSRLKAAIADDYLVPEFVLQSTRCGGMGALWFDKYGVDSCKRGFCTVRCSDDRICKHAIPLYYWHRLRKRHLSIWLDLRDQKIAWIKTHHMTIDYDELCNIAACAAEQLKHETLTEVIGNEEV